MDLWEQVILEWMNCLGVLKTPIKDIRELYNVNFYKELINKLPQEDYKDMLAEDDIISSFIKDKYPGFEINFQEKLEKHEELQIASLVLLHTAREPTFHRPMCLRLQHETQTKIKSFLEMLLPYEKNVTKEVLLEAITELEDASPKDLSTTPKVKPLKEFFNSPAARSAHSHRVMTEHIRQIRQLKSELETERFEKMDLQEDLQIQQAKIQKLEKKLEEKTAELKALRAEQMRSRTPQSCKKGRERHSEDFYKREIEQLENELLKSQSLVERYDEEKNKLMKKMSAIEKQYIDVKEKYKHCEKSLEMATAQLELKDRELADLQTNNEALRAHLKEITRTSVEEPSFEGESLLCPRSPTVIGNIAESLSSVIDIQFQEAKEESASLRIELNSLNDKLEALTTDYQKVLTQNKSLQEKLEDMAEAEHCKNILSKQIEDLNDTVCGLEKSLLAETDEKLKFAQKFKEEQAKHIDTIKSTEADLRSLLQSKMALLNDNIILENFPLETLLEHLKQVVHNLEKVNDTQKTEILSLKEAIVNSKNTITALNKKISDLKEKHELNIKDIAEAEHCKSILHKQIEDLNDTVCGLEKSLLVETDEKLKLAEKFEEEHAKHIDTIKSTEANLRSLLQNKMALLNDNIILENFPLETLLEHLKQVVHNLEKVNDTQKTEILSLKEAIVNSKNTITALNKKISDLKEKHELNIKDIAEAEHCKSILHKQIEDLNDTVCGLEKSLLVETDEKLKLAEKFEKEHAKHIDTIKSAEANLRSLLQNKMALLNDNIILENFPLETLLEHLKQVVHNLEKVNDTQKTEILSLKEAIVNSNSTITALNKQISDLKEKHELNIKEIEIENGRMINLHKNTESKTEELVQTLEKQLLEKQHSWEQLNVKVKLKEETLAALQTEMEDLTKEKITSELKMKEVILNLQEVRINQDAVLTAQEKALNEKCSQLEQVQRELNEVKEVFSKQLNTEKSLCSELQVQNSMLTDEIEKYVKNIEELREDLKQKTTELCKNQEYCEAMDIEQSKILQTLEELKDSIVHLRTLIVEICPDQKVLQIKNTECTLYNIDVDNDEKVNKILNIIQTSAGEINTVKLGISHLQHVYKDFQETLSRQGKVMQKTEETNERIQLLTQTVQNFEIEKQSFNEYMQFLLRDTELLKEDFSEIMLSRETVEMALTVLKEKWSTAFNKFKHIFVTDSSMCDELKHLQAKKEELDKTLHDYEISHLENMRPLTKMLWETFLRTQDKLENIHMRLVKTQQNEVNIKLESKNNFSEEKKIIELELKHNKSMYKNIVECDKEVEMFLSVASSYENNVNAGQIKKEPRAEEKLKLQIDQLTKEKKDLKLKLDNMRVRNAKLEKNMDDLRAELKKMKVENSSNELSALEVADKKVKQLEEDISHLQKENEELRKRPKEDEFDNRLKEVHSKYELTLENMKQKMKTAYNEQVTKMNKQQERIVQEKMDEMKNLCRKHADEIKRYKDHVGQLSKQIWSVSDNLLLAQSEKEEVTQQLHELTAKIHNTKQKCDEQTMVSTHARNRAAGNEDSSRNNLSRQSVRSVESTHEDRMYERRSSMRSIQAMGNAFNAEDEEGEVFDSRYLADLKKGECLPSTHLDRLSVLQMRNSLCKPHLKSSYPAETQFHPLGFTEEDIKNHSNMLQTGTVTEDVFNDSLTQKLLAEQKPKKKDRTQTSYKKPGPPTPSKNGGRLSLQGNELRSPNSRILRDRNVERRTTITPRRLKDIFSTSSSKRQDENSTSTPKGRRLSNIFRKPRTATERF